MAGYLYVCAQDDDKILVFAQDTDTGGLTLQQEIAAEGGPTVLAISPDQRTVYVGFRTVPAIASYRIGAGGGLTSRATVSVEHPPTFLACDRTGGYLLSAYYQGGGATVHPLGADGAVGAAAGAWIASAVGAHAIATDRSNRFAFVPHIANLNDNVLEPRRENPGPNKILQFRFDAATGRLSPNTPFEVIPAGRTGPRHFCFHPTQDVVYFSDEQGCSVTSYRLDPATGALSSPRTIATLPDGFAGRNTCSQIHMTPSGRFLYVPNRGHNSIAGFAADPVTGDLTPVGRVATEAVPSAFCLDPAGRFVYAAGTASGRLASYRVDEATGVLTPLTVYAAGQRPAAVLCVHM